MNKNKEECTSFCTRFNDLLLDVKNKSHSVHIGIAVPYTLFNSCNFDSSVAVYAQNVSDMDKGAYTGQISTHMLKDTGIYGSLVGHSEARKYQFETDAVINKKTLALINSGMKAIVCVGETLEEFEANKTLEVITRQIKIGLANVDKNYLDKVIIAYEPVWAIGTGKTATNDIVEKTCAAIKKVLIELYADANKIYVVYGGSVNEKNSKEILALDSVDGCLVGGAALDPDKFFEIYSSAPDMIK